MPAGVDPAEATLSGWAVGRLDGRSCVAILSLLLIPSVDIADHRAGRAADHRAGPDAAAAQTANGRATQRADGRPAQRTLLGGCHVGATDAEDDRWNCNPITGLFHHVSPYFALAGPTLGTTIWNQITSMIGRCCQPF